MYRRRRGVLSLQELSKLVVLSLEAADALFESGNGLSGLAELVLHGLYAPFSALVADARQLAVAEHALAITRFLLLEGALLGVWRGVLCGLGGGLGVLCGGWGYDWHL